MKVKCIKEYYDKEKDGYVKKDTEFDVKEDRACVLISHKVVQELKEKPKEEPKEKQQENKGNTGANK